ncbi:hypothetical protein PINS_up015546 [Pythium insidiosum]|nr:hypothetical protein PINS_up015546 [Pythium insidiosum]
MTEDDAMMQDVLRLLLMDSDGEHERDDDGPDRQQDSTTDGTPPVAHSVLSPVLEPTAREYSQLKKRIRTKLTSKRFVRRRKDEAKAHRVLSTKLKQELERLTMLDSTVVEPHDLRAQLRNLRLEETMLQQDLDRSAQWSRQVVRRKLSCALHG